jgi:hypothetical protein
MLDRVGVIGVAVRTGADITQPSVPQDVTGDDRRLLGPAVLLVLIFMIRSFPTVLRPRASKVHRGVS